MNSKQLVLDALHNKEVERIPWVPFVGCHAATLLGVTAEEYFKSEDYMVQGVEKAFELYRPDGLPALFDLQVEAEALGCQVRYATENPPAVMSHPMEDGVTLADLKVPEGTERRYPIVLRALERIVRSLGDKIAIYGLITGPFTLALHLRGTDLFFDLIEDPDAATALMDFCRDVCIRTADLYMDRGADIIAVVDPVVSQISPANFADFVSPAATAIFDHIRSRGKGGSFFVCGNAKRNIEEMCKCHPDNISIDENIPLDYVKETAEKYGVSVGGNIQLTVTMLFGTPADNINDARNCMAIGGKKGYILSPGCDMPFATPVENVQAIASLVYGEDAEYISSHSVLDGIEVEIPDYPNEKTVIVDAITLDSASCAPCQYTMEAIAAAVAGIEDKVTVVEHKIKEKEAVVFMMKMGVKNIPTIVIDGEVKFISLIPEVPALRKEIEEAIGKKGL